MTEQKHFHKVTPDNLIGKTALQYGINKKLLTQAPEFSSNFADHEMFGHFDETTYFAMGAELENIVSYARCYEDDHIIPTARGKSSSTRSFILPSKNLHTGEKIDKKNIAQQPGYDKFSAQGKVLNIVTMESVIKGHKFDSELMKHIQQQGYELIAAAASCIEQPIYRAHGFIHSGLVDDCPIYVWNNPAFRNR